MKLITTLFVCLIVLVSITAIFGFVEFPIYSQCSPQFQLADHNSQITTRMCEDGHVLTSLSMAMMSRNVKTNFDQNQDPQIYPNTIASYLIKDEQMCPEMVFSTTFNPQLLSKMSSNMHYTISFQPTQLHDSQVNQLCEQIVSSPAIYIADMNQNDVPTSVWLTFCAQDEHDDLVLFYHHPIFGEKSMLWSSFISTGTINIHEILISYNLYQQEQFNNLVGLISNSKLTKQQQIATIFNKNQRSIYTSLQSIDDWVIPRQWFTSWKQGDYKDIMTTKTIAAVGCLMCSVAVGLRNRDITLPNNILVEPSAWNTFIKANAGYDNDNFIHETVNHVCEGRAPECYSFYNATDGRHAKNDLTPEQVHELLKEGKRHVVANVNNGGHFVAIIGYSKSKPDRFKAIDSAGGTHQREWYDHSEIVGYRLYDLVGPFELSKKETKLQFSQDELLARSFGF
jgi:hypothetical protein